MITYQIEDNSKWLTKEFSSMFGQHWREIGIFDKKKIKLSVNWDFYRAIAKNNTMILYSVRNDEMLIGYALFIIANHPHYSTTKVAENDVIYLLPQFRKGYTGYNFIKFCIDDLKRKVNIITMNTKVDHSFEIIMRRLKFRLTDYVFTLEI